MSYVLSANHIQSSSLSLLTVQRLTTYLSSMIQSWELATTPLPSLRYSQLLHTLSVTVAMPWFGLLSSQSVTACPCVGESAVQHSPFPRQLSTSSGLSVFFFTGTAELSRELWWVCRCLCIVFVLATVYVTIFLPCLHIVRILSVSLLQSAVCRLLFQQGTQNAAKQTIFTARWHLLC